MFHRAVKKCSLFIIYFKIAAEEVFKCSTHTHTHNDKCLGDRNTGYHGLIITYSKPFTCFILHPTNVYNHYVLIDFVYLK